MYFVDLKGKKS
jgi:hypothetical protein